MAGVTDRIVPDEELIPAATVLLLRDSSDGPEALMLRRNSKVAFGGMWVFPGGKVDDDELIPNNPQESARIAAAREVQEETSLEITGADLETWSYWIPPLLSSMQGRHLKRFSTWFFVGRAPDGVDVAVDGGEIHEHRWMSPATAMAERDNKNIELVPPTWVTLWQVAQHGSVDEAMAWAAATEPEEFRTKAISQDPLTVAWAQDAGYEAGDASKVGPRHRLTMHPTGWSYERSQ